MPSAWGAALLLSGRRKNGAISSNFICPLISAIYRFSPSKYRCWPASLKPGNGPPYGPFTVTPEARQQPSKAPLSTDRPPAMRVPAHPATHTKQKQNPEIGFVPSTFFSPGDPAPPARGQTQKLASFRHVTLMARRGAHRPRPLQPIPTKGTTPKLGSFHQFASQPSALSFRLPDPGV